MAEGYSIFDAFDKMSRDDLETIAEALSIAQYDLRNRFREGDRGNEIDGDIRLRFIAFEEMRAEVLEALNEPYNKWDIEKGVKVAGRWLAG